MTDKAGVVKIHGKEYKTVILRVNEFRENCKAADGWGIVTELVFHDKDRVVVHAKILDPSGRVVGSGLGEEVRNATPINKTSAMEVAETSAIGRALASIGLGGEEYASADEVLNAIKGQSQVEQPVVKEDDRDPKIVMAEKFADLYKHGCEVMGTEKFFKTANMIIENGYGGRGAKDLPIDDARNLYMDIAKAIKNGG